MIFFQTKLTSIFYFKPVLIFTPLRGLIGRQKSHQNTYVTTLSPSITRNTKHEQKVSRLNRENRAMSYILFHAEAKSFNINMSVISSDSINSKRIWHRTVVKRDGIWDHRTEVQKM